MNETPVPRASLHTASWGLHPPPFLVFIRVQVPMDP